MGMFNSVWITCPHCGESIEEQTKAGSCLLKNYGLDSAPIADLVGVSNSTIHCEKCSEPFHVLLQVIKSATVVKGPYEST